MSLLLAIVISILLSILICLIEVRHQSKTKDIFTCKNSAVFIYLAILIVGNAATTSIAYAIVDNYAKNPNKNVSISGPTASVATQNSDTVPPNVIVKAPNFLLSFFAAFLGVFAFEAMLQRINVTFANQGVLTINDWIGKARDAAVVGTLAKSADEQLNKEQKVAQLLHANAQLDDAKLNSYVQSWLGNTTVAELEALAIKNHADVRLTKALALVAGAYERASKLVQ